MKEYEYCFEVKSLEPYFDYCKKNGFKLVEAGEEERTIYRKSDGTMARITTNSKNGNIKKRLDFKEDKLSAGALNVRKESLPIEIAELNAAESVLEFLNYKKDNTLLRKRFTFEKYKVKFEIDKYIKPKIAYVVAIEGEKDVVDKIYLDIKNLG